MSMGAIVGSYRILRELGQGGMGTVYLGEHALLGRKAAIKLLLPELSTDTSIVDRFFNEAKATTQVTDPGIVQVFDFGYAASGGAYIVMELLEGETLAARLARVGRLAIVDAVRMCRLLCGSLEAAHVQGIVHRDLKPENVFLVADAAVPGGERPKVLDFGIAKLSRERGRNLTLTGTVMGTPLYMSPEQCRGAGAVDHRADIYAIACVLLAMLTGEPPFCYEGAGELISAHLTQPPPLAGSRVPGIPANLEAVLQRGLAKDPAQRFQTMAELARALAAVEDALQLAAFTPPAGVPLARPVLPTTTTAVSGQMVGGAPPRRRNALALAGAGAAIVIGALAIGLAVHAHGDAAASGSASTPASTATVAEPAVPAPTPAAVAPADAALPATVGVDAASPAPSTPSPSTPSPASSPPPTSSPPPSPPAQPVPASPKPRPHAPGTSHGQTQRPSPPPPPPAFDRGD